uniref:Aspartate aminotransferase, mitochondrial n=1 Tax=Electrophorus electricus TaxID=8005 RepID=A0A4W4E904_ELEEL
RCSCLVYFGACMCIFEHTCFDVHVLFGSWWTEVQMGPPDPILGVKEASKQDSNPQKFNLGDGAYRDDKGEPYVPSCVQKVSALLLYSTHLQKHYVYVKMNEVQITLKLRIEDLKWKDVYKVGKDTIPCLFWHNLQKQNVLVFFDMDAWAVRHFTEQGHNIFLSQSFAKNMDLYGKHLGGFIVVCMDAKETKKVESHLKILILPIYSSPPMSGARIVATILNSPALHSMWYDVYWNYTYINFFLVFFLSFYYVLLKPDQVEQLIKEFSVYMTKLGRNFGKHSRTRKEAVAVCITSCLYVLAHI